MKRQFRIKKVEYKDISVEYAKISSNYYIQEKKKFLFWEYWADYKVRECYGCDCQFVRVVFNKLKTAKKYLKEIREIIKQK